MFGSVKSQILVKDQFSNLHKINIDLFSNGENLVQVLATELGEELEKNCNITFGTKKVKKYNFSKYYPFKYLFVQFSKRKPVGYPVLFLFSRHFL